MGRMLNLKEQRELLEAKRMKEARELLESTRKIVNLIESKEKENKTCKIINIHDKILKKVG